MSEFVTAKVEIEETAATIGAKREFLSCAVEAIKAARQEVERQIRRDPFFLTTIEPYSPGAGASRVVQRMCDASEAAGVGPMAAVAGAIAQEGLEAMVSEGCQHCWVDNGGDVALRLGEPVTLEVFSEPRSGSTVAFEVETLGTPLGICTSSGKLGHSISFGNADAAVVIAEDAVLADAFATALGNRVSKAEDLATCFGPFGKARGLIGALVMLDGAVATYGRVPRLVEAEHNPERLTVHTQMSSKKFLGSQDQTTEVRV